MDWSNWGGSIKWVTLKTILDSINAWVVISITIDISQR